MDATTFAARFVPVAAMLGVGTVIAISGGAVAFAEPSDAAPSSVERTDDSVSSTSTADDVTKSRRDRDDADAGAAPGATGPAGRDSQDDADEAGPEPEPAETEDFEASDSSPTVQNPDPDDTIATADEVSDHPPVRTTSSAAVSEPSGPANTADSAAARNAAQANPIADFFDGIAALFNNRTPTLSPTPRFARPRRRACSWTATGSSPAARCSPRGCRAVSRRPTGCWRVSRRRATAAGGM